MRRVRCRGAVANGISDRIANVEKAALRSGEEVLGEKVAQPIVNGSPATAYTEAALINTDTFICSGAVIAPRMSYTLKLTK